MDKVDLKIDWATHKAAKYACEHWHYSRCMPVGKLVKIGVWEEGVFIGVVLFGRGASNNLLRKYDLNQDKGAELVRIALSIHRAFVSQIISKSIKLLCRFVPELRLLISFADTGQGHYGGIYQATNWIYSGMTNDRDRFYIIRGKKIHPRSVSAKYGTRSIPVLKKMGISVGLCDSEPKHRYLMPLDKKMRKQILPLSKPYPKKQAAEAGNGSDQEHSGGSTPIQSLQQAEVV